MERRGEAFDYILLETTGLADPGNIAPVFWVDEGLGSTIYLDGIVTLVDAANLLRSLDHPVGDELVHHEEGGHVGPELSIAHLQISHADVIVINKADLVGREQLEAVETRVRSINALARLYITDHSRVPDLEGLILDLHAYDSVDAASLDFASKGHSHLDPAIGTVTLSLPTLRNEQVVELDRWLRSVLWDGVIPGFDESKGWEIHRTKGRIHIQGGRMKLLQGVREIFELIDGPDTSTDEGMTEAEGKIVFIGRSIGVEQTRVAFQHSLDLAISRS